MIISVNWLKKFTDIDIPIDELATLIGERLVEIEEVIDLGAKYKDVIAARVVSCEDMPDSDHLHVCRIDDGGVRQDVERDADGYVQVVCGAPNVREGLQVAWLPPQAVVPETYNDSEPFVLGARKLRGYMSNGMLASAKELDLFEDHDGILELDSDMQPGASFAEVYELNDYLLDIENKSLTHRPDTFGIIGFAREVAAIQGKTFTTPDWLGGLEPMYGSKQGDVAAPTVTIDDPTLSDRYQAVVVSGADGSKKSPLHIQTYLARVGVRPISAVVDVTNYLMMLTGQPLHAFDYDKVLAVGGSTDIHVRAGRENETLTLLDGRTIELTSGDIVIAAGETAIGLAGAMGGSTTEIDANTKNIIIESATFNLYNLRATQMRHGIFSEAITRFTKGQPAPLTAPVLADAVRLMGEWAGAVRVSDVADTRTNDVTATYLRLPLTRVNDVLGGGFDDETVLNTLRRIEFAAEIDGHDLVVTVPYWRADIHIAEDVIEEVGRLGGFDNITATLPRRDFRAVAPSNFDDLRRRMRMALVRAGANEVLTYSFVHGDVLRKSGQDPVNSYRITNSISPDLQYYRQSLTPSLLGLVHPNIKNGYDSFAVFELNKVHTKTAELVEDVPAEMHRLGLVLANKKPEVGATYYQAKAILEYLATSLGLELAYKPVEATNLAVMQPFEPKRSARVIEARSGQPVGVIGEYKTAVTRSFKLPQATAGFELFPEAILLAVNQSAPRYTPLSRFPGTERDICFQVTEDVTYAQVVDGVLAGLHESDLETSVAPVDIYQAEGESTKNITVRIKMTAHDRTLTSDEAGKVTDGVIARVIESTAARVI
jgi:phenylalanyl-tRNA synthetase beta chain